MQETQERSEANSGSSSSSSSAASFVELREASASQKALMGGKAATLAHLLSKGFPVPEGAVLFSEPQTSEALQEVLTWWKAQGAYPVAARSSASGEDSADFSYAGQFVTVLNISTEEGLASAIKTCFHSVHLTASKAYASHFERAQIPMHVLIQRMIQPVYSGVFFSQDPRSDKEAQWLVEVVEGLGEQLVSGQVTPFRFTPEGTAKTPSQWRPEYLTEIVKWGLATQKEFNYLVDMEWAIDHNGRFWILQSRPITAKGALSERRKVLDEEWQRLLRDCNPESIWDGHTFAEWTGIPTEFTFDLWKKAFEPDQAFDRALKSIGYEGVAKAALLDRVFGRAYLNLKTMEPIYFGESPYQLVAHPRPHLEFSWSRLNLKTLLRAPQGIYEMSRVAWRVQTGRREIAQKALQQIQSQNFAGLEAETLRLQAVTGTPELQQQRLAELVRLFTQDCLQSTFLITLLIESTTQGLLALLEKDLGAEKATEMISHLTGHGLKTMASEMYQELSQVQGSEEKWQQFLKKFGHRGVGELELSHPRWFETQVPQAKKQSARKTTDAESLLEDLLKNLSALRRPVFSQEWEEMQRLLQVREQIKMEIMKPYAQIRWILQSLGQKFELGADILWLSISEVQSLQSGSDQQTLLSLIQERKQKAQFFRSVDLPMIFSLQELKKVLDGEEAGPSQSGDLKSTVIRGVSLAPGVAAGVVHVVLDPENEDLDSWPENVILVAEATDPGWTPLFERAKGVIVTRGGVLSHCAIVAREMGLVAVGEVRAATQVLKEGEYVWIDGNHGLVRRAH